MRQLQVPSAVVAAVLAGMLTLTACGGEDEPGGTAGPTATTTVPSDDAPSTADDPSPVPTSNGPSGPGATPSRAPTPQPTSAPPTQRPGPTTPSAAPAPTPTSAPSAPPVSDLVRAWSGQDVEAFDTNRSVVALTFDGGASNTAVADILATLDREGVPATFFVTGSFARAYPDSVRAIARAGHPVGNHSDTHPSFPDSTNQQIRAELRAADASISALTGHATAPLFRFPFGDRTPLDIQVVNGAGYIPIRWTVDTLGWKGTSEGITTAVVRERVLDTLRRGQVVLMHVGANPDDGSTLDADALPGIIDDLRARGYGFVTVPELLAEGS